MAVASDSQGLRRVAYCRGAPGVAYESVAPPLARRSRRGGCRSAAEVKGPRHDLPLRCPGVRPHHFRPSSPHASRQFLSNASGPESPSASRGGIARTELPGAWNQMLAVNLLITLRSPWFLSTRHPSSTAYARSSAMQPVPARTRAIRQVPATLKGHWMLRKTIKRASLRNNRKQMVGWDGIEPPTPGFSDLGLGLRKCA